MQVCIYARVSTNRQELDQQIVACHKFCEFKGLDVKHVYADVVSGAKAKRPMYLLMVDLLRRGSYDGVVVFRLDRLGRNARELALLIDELEGRGIRVLSVNESFDTSTAIGRAMREIILVFAQLEREQIGEATRQRLAALKAQGKKLGRAPLSRAQVAVIRALRGGGASYRRIEAVTSCSYGTVFSVVNKRGVYGDAQKYPENGGYQQSALVDRGVK